MIKVDIRKNTMKLRNSLTRDELEEYSYKITNRVIKSTVYKKARSIFIYISFGSEVETRNIIEDALISGKKIYVPKTNKKIKEMIAVEINNFNNMTVDKWGILEPSGVDKNNIGKDFDLIIMPGVAFDRNGNRIGYGGGYYDKYIYNSRDKYRLLALAYDIQIVQNMEVEVHDIVVDYIVTEKEFINIGNK